MDNYEMDMHNSTYISHLIKKDCDKHCDKNRQVKQKAFLVMKELEGWCTEQKATVLIDLVLMLKPAIIVEIGVFGGKSLVPMAFALNENGFGKIYGIDPWTNVSSVEGMNGANKEYWNQINHETIYRNLQNKIYQLHLNEQIDLIRATSEDADPIYNIDFLHIDGNHSEKASMIDVTKWVPYVKKGGIIIFDDINWSSTETAVNWLDQNCTKFAEFSNENVWGIWIKK